MIRLVGNEGVGEIGRGREAGTVEVAFSYLTPGSWLWLRDETGHVTWGMGCKAGVWKLYPSFSYTHSIATATPKYTNDHVVLFPSISSGSSNWPILHTVYQPFIPFRKPVQKIFKVLKDFNNLIDGLSLVQLLSVQNHSQTVYNQTIKQSRTINWRVLTQRKYCYSE